mgnify:CR=1 FL=1
MHENDRTLSVAVAAVETVGVEQRRKVEVCPPPGGVRRTIT